MDGRNRSNKVRSSRRYIAWRILNLLNPKIPVTRETPPTFLLQAEDDPCRQRE